MRRVWGCSHDVERLRSDNESGNDGLGLAVDAVSATDPLAVTASSSPRDLVKCASASKTELRFGPEALCHGAASLLIEAAELAWPWVAAPT